VISVLNDSVRLYRLPYLQGTRRGQLHANAYDSFTPGPRVGSPMGPLLGTTSLTGVGLMTSATAWIVNEPIRKQDG